MLLWQIRNFGKFYSNSTVNSHQQIQLNGKTVCNFWKGMKQTVETIESLKRALRTPYMLSSILNNSSEKAIKCLSSVAYNSYAAFNCHLGYFGWKSIRKLYICWEKKLESLKVLGFHSWKTAILAWHMRKKFTGHLFKGIHPSEMKHS